MAFASRRNERRLLEEEWNTEDEEYRRRVEEERDELSAELNVDEVSLASPRAPVPSPSMSSEASVQQVIATKPGEKRPREEERRLRDSNVWKHFEETVNKKKKCKYCPKSYANSTSTGNLRDHVKEKHSSRYERYNV